MPIACAAIVNPAAANGRVAALWPRLIAEMRAHALVAAVFITAGPGTATEITRQALLAGHETIVAIGGDGTVNEVVNGFFTASGPINPAARLGIVSCGTGADLVKSLGLPPRRAAIAYLAAGHTVTVDLGLASFQDLAGHPTTRYFLNVADLGLGGETVARVNRTTKALGGFASFLLGSTLTILSYRGKQAEIIVDDGEPLQMKVGLVVAANGQYFGGGMHVAPEASLTDGLLDVLLLEDLAKPQLLFDLLPKVYRGAHVRHPRVWTWRGKRLVVRCSESMLLDLDGELAGMADAEFRVLPAALAVLAPPDQRATGAGWRTKPPNAVSGVG